MGCTASKSLEMQARREGWSPPVSGSFVRSMSMPLRSPKSIRRSVAARSPAPDVVHVVALTSSTYGALRIPHEDDRQSEEPGKELVEKRGLPSVPEADVIDLGELMRDLNEDESKSQVMVAKRPRRVRGLSRSISAVDSMRELDVKIKTVALALPNLEKKLRALDALCSISRCEEPSSDQSRELFKSFLTDQGAESSPERKRKPKKELQATKSMKGLFYGETLPPPKPSIAASSASNSSSSATSDSSGPASSWDTDSALFDPEILKTFQTEIDVSPRSPQPGDHSETSASSDSSPPVSLPNSAPKKLAKKMMSSKVAAIEVEEQRLKSPQQGSAGPLDAFLEVCPPKGENRAVLYVTSLRGIRKTFEDCNRVRMILQGFGIAIDERDVSMHSEFKQEMAELLSQVSSRNSDVKPVLPVPRLFIRGRYIGGVEEVGQLNEDGVMEKVVEGVARRNPSEVCEGCGGMRFVPCFECSGSCKKVVFGGKMNYSGSGMVVRCSDCNENGLIRCPVCL